MIKIDNDKVKKKLLRRNAH